MFNASLCPLPSRCCRGGGPRNSPLLRQHRWRLRWAIIWRRTVKPLRGVLFSPHYGGDQRPAASGRCERSGARQQPGWRPGPRCDCCLTCTYVPAQLPSLLVSVAARLVDSTFVLTRAALRGAPMFACTVFPAVSYLLFCCGLFSPGHCQRSVARGSIVHPSIP